MTRDEIISMALEADKGRNFDFNYVVLADLMERFAALVGEDKIALDRHNSEIRSELVAVLTENKRLRAQVATLTETIEVAQHALNAAPAWHQGIRDAIDVLNKSEVK